MSGAPPLKAYLPAIETKRVSELVAGVATVGFSIAATTSWVTSLGLDVGPTARKAISTQRYIALGYTAGFAIVLAASVYTALRTTAENRKQTSEFIGASFFLVTSVCSAVAVGGVFKDVSLIDVYQSAERNAIIDQNVTITWFVATWAVIWGVMRALNTNQKAIINTTGDIRPKLENISPYDRDRIDVLPTDPVKPVTTNRLRQMGPVSIM